MYRFRTRPLRCLSAAAVAAVSANDGSSSSPAVIVPLPVPQQPLPPVALLPSPVPSTSPPAAVAVKPADRGGPLAQAAIGGLVTILFEAFGGGHFYEFLKVNKQTSSATYPELVRRITATKGIVGVLDGFLPWGLLQALAKGAVFTFGQAEAAALLHDVHWLSREEKTVLSGTAGGLVQGIVLSPLLLLKTRVMTDASFRGHSGMMETAVASAAVGARVVREEGVQALMKGAGIFAAKRAADWTTRYMFVVMVEEALRPAPKAKLSDDQLAFAALAGGALSALATIPMDVLVSTKQAASKAGHNVSILETFREQVRAGGMVGTVKFACRGLVARVWHVACTTFMMRFMTTRVYEVFYGREDDV